MAAQPLASEPQELDSTRLYIWVKGLESKINNLLREVDVLKNDYMRKNAQQRKELKALGDDILEFKREQQKAGEKMDLVIKELKKTAGSEDLAVLKKYIDLWNPLHFVTQRDLERALEVKLAAVQRPAISNNSSSSPISSPPPVTAATSSASSLSPSPKRNQKE